MEWHHEHTTGWNHTTRMSQWKNLHTLFNSGHIEIQCTLKLVENKFRWPSLSRELNMSKSVQSVHNLLSDIYPQACWNCPFHMIHGHTSPLIASHITGFPTIFVIFYKIFHILSNNPLPKFLTAMETAKIIFSKVFRHKYQFTSRVWKAWWQFYIY